VLAAAVRWVLFPGDHTILSIVGGWAVFNFIIVSAALRAVAERQQRRGVPRVDMNTPAVAAIGSSGQFSFAAGTILDASTSGARLKLVAGPDTDMKELLSIAKGYVLYFTPEFPRSPHLENAIRAQVAGVERVNSGIIVGLRFDPAQPMNVRETIAHLIFGDSAAWERVRAGKSAPMPLLRGMAYVVALSVSSVYHTLRALRGRTRAPPCRGRARASGRDGIVTARAFAGLRRGF
jgi:cellulose synthase (UDP-forming)